MAGPALKWREFYFSYKGRVSLKELWLLWLLPKAAVGLVFTLIDKVIGIYIPLLNLGLMESLLILLTIWPDTAIMNKRMHDRGHSGWFPVFLMLPLGGQIAYYLFTLGRMPRQFALWDIIPWLFLLWFVVEYALMPGKIKSPP